MLIYWRVNSASLLCLFIKTAAGAFALPNRRSLRFTTASKGRSRVVAEGYRFCQRQQCAESPGRPVNPPNPPYQGGIARFLPP